MLLIDDDIHKSLTALLYIFWLYVSFILTWGGRFFDYVKTDGTKWAEQKSI